jgi:hypothetical protein
MQRLASDNAEPLKPASSLADWPEVMPPFAAASIVGSPDGHLVLRRERVDDHRETVYDVIGRDGSLRRQVIMPGNARIVGFGATSVFVAYQDDNGIERLRRHPWS